jgi:hypothetical protein
MRVLTKSEKSIFNAAYTCIMRVATLETGSVHDAMANGKHLPRAYVDLVMEVGGMGMLQDMYCPMRKDEAIEHLVSYCFARKIQPREFIFDGPLSVSAHAIPVVEHTYISNSEQ